MKLKTIAKSLIALSTAFVLGACGNNTASSSQASKGSESELKTVKIASVGSDEDIWRHIAESEQAKKAGLKIEVQEINGGVPLNESVADGTVDANAFQSIGYLQGFNEANSNKLVPIGTTYIEPMGLYSKKVKSLNDLPNGAKIAIPDSPYNATRALRLLESAGLIKLSSSFKEGTGTTSDIVENKKNFEFLMIDDTTSVRVLDDADLIAIGNTIALEGGLNVLKDALFYEKADESTITSINVIVVKAENADKEEYKKLVELYHDPEIQKYISEQFAGTKVEVSKPIRILEVHENLILVQSGIGKANAAAASAWLCDKVHPDLIINTGTTGSFNPELGLADVIVSTKFAYSDVDATGFDYAWGQVPQMPADYPVDVKLQQKVLTLLREQVQNFSVHSGFIATSDSFMSSVDAVENIRAKLPDITASDMEAAPIAQVASFYDIPVLNIRGISDHVGGDAPDTFEETLEKASQNAFEAVRILVENFL